MFVLKDIRHFQYNDRNIFAWNKILRISNQEVGFMGSIPRKQVKIGTDASFIRYYAVIDGSSIGLPRFIILHMLKCL